MTRNSKILTSDNSGLQIFEDGVSINKDLPKWRRAEEGMEKTVSPKNNSLSMNEGSTPQLDRYDSEDVDSDISSSTAWLGLYRTPYNIDFDELAKANIRELTRMLVEKKVKYVMGGYGSFGTTVSNNNSYLTDFDVPYVSSSNNAKSKKSFFKRLFEKKSKEKKEKYEFDALKFFSLVKTTSQESADTYRDRIANYLKALHNSMLVGQTALQEEILRNMVANKYESLLYAEGFYHVIDEPTMVDFVKRSEKGVAMDYVKNYMRPIPQEAVDKINKANELEVFDNFVVLHFDPESKSYKETEYERAKRKDPIIFGVIAGSKKLYYITDWVDEFCDLTLDKFVDTLEIENDSLKIKDTYQ
jgi:hypothetical protein